jgi:hypothetical protein
VWRSFYAMRINVAIKSAAPPAPAAAESAAE